MLIIALVLAVIGLAALVTAVVTGNEMVAWVCIAASVFGVLLLIVDAIRERQQSVAASDEAGSDDADDTAETTYENFDADYPTDEYTEEPPTGAIETQSDVDTAVDDEPVDLNKVDNDNR